MITILAVWHFKEGEIVLGETQQSDSFKTGTDIHSDSARLTGEKND